MDYLTALFLGATVHFQLPPGLLSSLCYIESRHQVNAIHHDDGRTNSVGICQVKLETAKWLGFKGTEKDLMDPRINIYYAGLYLKKQLMRYNAQTNKAVIAYNYGHAGSLTQTDYQVRVFKHWRKSLNE
jgi:soluble lytic murein transglycosylase-like protein